MTVTPTPDRPALKVGDTIWIFDYNRRVYPKGRGIGSAPIYREHWGAHTITGETRVSWICGTRKVKKVRENGSRDFAASAQEVEDDVWVNDHRMGIERALRGCDASTLRAVAELIGYDPARR